MTAVKYIYSSLYRVLLKNMLAGPQNTDMSVEGEESRQTFFCHTLFRVRLQRLFVGMLSGFVCLFCFWFSILLIL